MKSPKAELFTKRSDFSPSGLLKPPLSEQWQNSLKKFPASKWRDFFQSNARRRVFVGLLSIKAASGPMCTYGASGKRCHKQRNRRKNLRAQVYGIQHQPL